MKVNSQKIAIIGMWHQGVVGAACLAEIGHNIIGLDKDKKKINKLNDGKAPLFEPKLDKLIQSGIRSNKLKFSHTKAYHGGVHLPLYYFRTTEGHIRLSIHDTDDLQIQPFSIFRFSLKR